MKMKTEEMREIERIIKEIIGSSFSISFSERFVHVVSTSQPLTTLTILHVENIEKCCNDLISFCCCEGKNLIFRIVEK